MGLRGYFPASYAHATWHRLAPFFRLPGWITWGADTVRVGVRPFNDRQFNRDLRVLCEQINEARPHLPDGRRLYFTLAETAHLLTEGAQDRIA
jgi:hypothetical protein